MKYVYSNANIRNYVDKNNVDNVMNYVQYSNVGAFTIEIMLTKPMLTMVMFTTTMLTTTMSTATMFTTTIFIQRESRRPLGVQILRGMENQHIQQGDITIHVFTYQQ